MIEEHRLSESASFTALIRPEVEDILSGLVANVDAARDDYASAVNRCAPRPEHDLGRYARSHYALEHRLMEIVENTLLKERSSPVIGAAVEALAEADILFKNTLAASIEAICSCRKT